MAKTKREVGNKSHKLRKSFIISSIALGVIAIGAGVFVSFTAAPMLVVLNSCLIGGALCIAVGVGVAANKTYDSATISINKGRATSALKKIKELNKDKTSNYSENYRAKIVKKYAKANLVLARKLGASIFGEFHSTSGMVDEKATQLVNEIDSFTLLKDASKERGQKKFSKKISLAEKKLSKLSPENSTPKCKWTKGYSEVLSGVEVLDRRTEIACLTTTARDSFIKIVENENEEAKGTCVNVIVNFNSSSNITPCIARSQDKSKYEEIRELMIKDILEACKTKTNAQIKCMFPITIESRFVDKKSTKYVNNTLTFDSYTELASALDKETEKI